MQRHLDDDGCTLCARRLEAVRRLAALARSDAGITLPAGARRMAKSIAALTPTEGSSEKTRPRPMPMRLVFDTAVAAATESTRRRAASERQMVFEAQSHTLHVRVERSEGSDRCHLVGQLEDRHGETLGGVLGCLVADDGAVRYLVTNDRGEFDVAAELGGEIELRFLVAAELRVTATLPPA